MTRRKTRRSRRLLPVIVLLLSLAPAAQNPSQSASEDWTSWGGSPGSNRYSSLDQVTLDNASELEVVWRWKAANYGPEVDNIYRATPIKIGDRLYAVAGQRRTVVCIDAATGETLWMWRMKDNPRWQASTRKNYGKGVAWANVQGRDVIYVITPGYYMAALDAETGLPLPHFGINGIVDLHLGLGYPVEADTGTAAYGDITSSSPPIVVNGVIVVGNSHDRGYYPSQKENIPGHVRGYDARTGNMLWRFHVIPQPGEFGHDTWEDDSWTYTGNVSSWAPLSADPERGLVFIPTDTPTNDYYGGQRKGQNVFGTSIIALDVKTGKRVWHFQFVHHDVWNYDTPNAPKVVDVTMADGRRMPMVIQTTKQGWAYIFNRVTGEPVWPIEERPVPRSDTPGEVVWPTQPFPSRPAPFEHQGITEDDLIDYTPELREQALELARQYRMGPIFTPPSLAEHPDGTKGAFVAPGANGGANIPGGSAVDPEAGILFVATTKGHSVISLVKGSVRNSTAAYVSTGPGGIRGPQGLPLLKPPYSTIVAIDLKTGDHMWTIPNGDTPDSVKEHPALQGVELPRTGKSSHANVLATRSVLFIGEGRGGDPILRAVDKMTGEIRAEIELPATTNTAPMTYMLNGRQYIVCAIADPDTPAEFVALALPEE